MGPRRVRQAIMHINLASEPIEIGAEPADEGRSNPGWVVSLAHKVSGMFRREILSGAGQVRGAKAEH